MSNRAKYFKQKIDNAIKAEESVLNNFNTMILVDLESDDINGWYNLPPRTEMNVNQLIELLQTTTSVLDKRFAFFLHREQNNIGEPTCVIVHRGKILSSSDGFDGVEARMNILMINTMVYLTDQVCAPPSFILNGLERKQIQLIMVIDKTVHLIDTLTDNIVQRLKNEADKGHAGCSIAYLRITEPKTFAHLAPPYREPKVIDGSAVTDINCIQTPTITIDRGVVISVTGVTFQGSHFSVGLKMPDYTSGIYQVSPNGDLTKISDI